MSKNKLIMCHLEVDEQSMEIKISDPQKIDHLPNCVYEFSRNFMEGRKFTSTGLPSVLYLGPNQLRVVGAFKYGELSFLEIEGKMQDILECDSFVCVDAFHDEEVDEIEDAETREA